MVKLTRTLHVHHAFLVHFFAVGALLRRENACTFCGGLEQNWTTNFFFFSWTLRLTCSRRSDSIARRLVGSLLVSPLFSLSMNSSPALYSLTAWNRLLWDSLLEFNSRKNCQHLINWTRSNFEAARIHFLSDVFVAVAVVVVVAGCILLLCGRRLLWTIFPGSDFSL